MDSAYISCRWRAILARHGFRHFQDLWKKRLEPVDRGNSGRNGWSRVFILSLPGPEGRIHRQIIKRQQNFNSLTFLHPFRGIPTLEKEFANIRRYQKYGIPTVEPIYFNKQTCQYGDRAILITEYLDDYQPLNTLVHQWKQSGLPTNAIRKRLFVAVARQVKKLHQHALLHRHLKLKHLFVRMNENHVEVRLIDLEGTRWRPWGFFRGFRDLVTLNDSACQIKKTDRLRFFLAYCGIDHLDKSTRRFGIKILKRTQIKSAGRKRKSAASPEGDVLAGAPHAVASTNPPS